MKSKKKSIFGIMLSLALALVTMPVLSQAAHAQLLPIEYLDDNGEKQSCEDYTEVTSKTNVFEDGKWYVVRESAEVKDEINVKGTAHLILVDDKSLSVSFGINVPKDKKLNIYAQSTDDKAGSLTVTGAMNHAGIGGGYGNSGGTIIINGGKITANGGNYAAGIGGGQADGSYKSTCTVTINGGVVTANGNYNGAGIGGGMNGAGANVTINGGIVTASSGSSGENYAFGIGHGRDTKSSGTLSQGNLTIGDGVVMKVSSDNSEWSNYDETNRARYMATVPITKYPLWVGGVQVNEENASDVLVNDPVNAGKVSYTPAEGDTPAKLTLNGAIITTGYEYDDEIVYGIYYTAKEPLNIELPSGSDNKIIGTEAFDRGIRAGGANITFSGNGKLTAEGSYRGIDAYGITVDGSNVTAASDSAAIASGSDIVIINGTVNATGKYTGIYTAEDSNITIKDGNVTTKGMDEGSEGIESYGDVIIDGGTVEASGTIGIAGENVTINGGTVNATGTEDNKEGIGTNAHFEPAGIFAENILEIKGGKVIAAGDGYGMLALKSVKNHIDGTGWTDKAGTQGKTDIAINTEGQDLSKYKKVQFPAKSDDPAKVTTAPKGKSMTYNGSALALVTAGKASGGSMQYAIGKNATTAPESGWTTAIPKATNAGTYYVWYKAAGDKDHVDSKPACVKATIARKPQAVGKTIVRNTIADTSKKTTDVVYDAVPGATGYDIAYRSRNASKWVIKSVGKTTRATIGGLSTRGLYEIKVRAKKAENTNYKAVAGGWSAAVYRSYHTTQKIRLVSGSKGSFTMSWAKDAQATGYQVMFSTQKNGSGAAKNINTLGKKTTSFTMKGLKSGKTYYVQVRELKKVGKTTYIGNVSKPLAIKIK